MKKEASGRVEIEWWSRRGKMNQELSGGVGSEWWRSI
jgi:hypothetical protein